MFTGIVDRGEVVDRTGDRMVVRGPMLADCAIGASVAINGVCLTVVERERDACTFELHDETVARSTLGRLRAGSAVNVERPVRAGDELGGHIVQGHVDGVGIITAVTNDADGKRVHVSVPDALARYIVEKGSVTLDGVSLTVTEASDASFEVALIPHTVDVTTLGRASAGQDVNVEVDVLAKYVERLVTTPDRAS